MTMAPEGCQISFRDAKVMLRCWQAHASAKLAEKKNLNGEVCKLQVRLVSRFNCLE